MHLSVAVVAQHSHDPLGVQQGAAAGVRSPGVVGLTTVDYNNRSLGHRL